MRQNWTSEKRNLQGEKASDMWKNNSLLRENQRKAVLGDNNYSRKNPPKGELNPMYGVHRYGAESPRSKKVECVNTGQVFDTVKEAAQWTGRPAISSHISAVCKGTRKVSGKHPETGEFLTWKYIEKGENK